MVLWFPLRQCVCGQVLENQLSYKLSGARELQAVWVRRGRDLIEYTSLIQSLEITSLMYDCIPQMKFLDVFAYNEKRPEHRRDTVVQ